MPFGRELLQYAVRAVKGVGLVLMLAATSALAADGRDWAEGSAASEGGADREFYNAAASLRWRKLHGDWRDRSGVLHGSKAYAQQTIAPTMTEQAVRFEVTVLVQQWLDHSFANRGFLLRMSEQSDGVVRFASREHPEPTLQPRLRLLFSSGEQLLLASADTDLDPSMAQSRGKQGTLKVSVGQHHALLRFELASVRQGLGRLQKAELVLTPLTRSGDTLTVQVFAADVPVPLITPAMPGLAEAYAGDIGIRQHPQVVYATGFDEPDWQAAWQNLPLQRAVHALPEFDRWQQQALPLWLGHGNATGAGTLTLLPWLGKAPEQLYVRYYLRITTPLTLRRGGVRLPGLVAKPATVNATMDTAAKAPVNVAASDATVLSATAPSATAGDAEPAPWRAYAQLLPALAGDNPLAGRLPVQSVWLDPGRADEPSRTQPWTEGEGAFLLGDRWYCVEQFLQLNSPGKADGIWQVWLDGQEVLNQRQLRIRRSASERIDQIQLDLNDAEPASAREQWIAIDNLVVARRYIGPMAPITDAAGSKSKGR